MTIFVISEFCDKIISDPYYEMSYEKALKTMQGFIAEAYGLEKTEFYKVKTMCETNPRISFTYQERGFVNYAYCYLEKENGESWGWSISPLEINEL